MPLMRLISLVDKKYICSQSNRFFVSSGTAWASWQEILCCIKQNNSFFFFPFFAISTWIVLPTAFTLKRSSDYNEWYQLIHCLANKYSPVPIRCLIGTGVLGTDRENKMRKHRGPAFQQQSYKRKINWWL